MKPSLQTKVSTLIALIIIVVSAISTYLLISSSRKDHEKKILARGAALNYSLSKAAEEGLASENLDLLKRAAHIVRAEDVVLIQVYSTIWEAVDAYPFEKLKDPPDPGAIKHFKNSDTPMYKKIGDNYDFYGPILFRPTDESPPVAIGFVRLTLSDVSLKEELKEIVVSNIIMSGIITLLAIIAIHLLIRHLVIKPVMKLHRSVSMAKNGALPDAVPVYSDDEIGDLSAEFNNMSAAIKDKTDRLIDSEKRIKSLFERVEHAIFRLDKDGNIIESNSRFDDMFGTVKSLCILLMSERKGRECLLNALSEKIVQVEESVMGKHGNELHVLLSVYPETDSEGKITGYDGYIIDITEKKKLEESLLQAQKMEAIGTLAGGVAHDFNNLLSAILGYSSFVKEQIDDSHPHYRYWNIIEQAALRGTELTSHLLAFSRKRSELKAKEPVEINALIKELVSLLSRTFNRSVTIKTRFSGERFYALGDSTALYQALLNICVNARDAMPGGGRLAIETLSFEASESFAVGHYQAEAGSYVQINITDTGSGMDKKVIERIFEPFFTTKELGMGTGLGLAIAYNIIKQHGGFIDVYSEIGSGTTFKLYLPAYGKDVVSGKEEIPVTDAEIAGKTILVADDEEPLRKLCKEILESANCNVLTAKDGFEAVTIFESKKDIISLVILDIIMPGMSGQDTLRKLKTIDPSVKVIISSGFSREMGAHWVEEKGITWFIEKPFRSQNLIKKVKEALLSRTISIE